MARWTLMLAGMLMVLLPSTPVAGRGTPEQDGTHWVPSPGLTWQIQFGEPLTGDPLPVQVYDQIGRAHV